MPTLLSITCPRCGEECASKNVLALHALGQHRCYREGTDIALKLRNNITRLRGAVEYILYREPGTRGGDDVQLEHWYNVFFTHREFYDSATQSFRPVQDPSVRVAQAHFITKQDTLARRRREVQREDLLLFHDREHPEIAVVPHECLLGGPQAQLRREVQEIEHRSYYSR